MGFYLDYWQGKVQVKRASTHNVHSYGIKKKKKRNICRSHEEYLAEQSCNQMHVQQQGVPASSRTWEIWVQSAQS